MKALSLQFSALVLALTPFFLTACGSDVGDDDSVQAQLEKNNQKLRDSYGSVAGVYDGELVLADAQLPLAAQILMYIDNVSDGVDPDGNPKSRPVLRAQLKLQEAGELDDHEFLVDYNNYSGAISFTQSSSGGGAPGGGQAGGAQGAGGQGGQGSASTVRSCPVGPKDPLLSIIGKALDGKINGSVNGSNGPIGTLKLKKTSNGETRPARDQRQRLLKAFEKVMGTYEGTTSLGAVTAGSRVVLRVEESSVGPGVTCPYLVADYSLVDTVGKLDDTTFAVSYRATTGEIYLSPRAGGGDAGAAPTGGSPAAGPRVCPVGPKDAQLAMDARMEDNGLFGELRGTGGVLGTVALRRTSKKTDAVNDQSVRLEKAYRSVIGTYAGRFSGATENFPVSITVTMASENIGGFVTCPVLTAQYARPDISSGYGSMVLDVDFYPVDAMVVFKSKSNETGGIPGHKNLTINAKWAPGQFEGPMFWWKHNGRVSAKRCTSGRVGNQGACL